MAPTVDIVPLSAGTARRRGGKFSSPQPEGFGALQKYITEVRSAGIVMCRYAAHTTWFSHEAPVLLLTADTFQPTQLFRTTPVNWAPGCSISTLPFPTTVQVFNLGAAEPSGSLSGLLSSTDPTLGISKRVESKLAEAVDLARDEWFEDGTESQFSRSLSTLLYTYGDATVAALETFLGSPSSNIEVAVEAAQWLGEADHSQSHHYRRTLLEKLLLSASSTRLRHGAAAGLAAIDDPASLPALREAREHEGNRRLQHYLELVIEQLERTSACRSS
jgi:hypothetical protein